MMSFGTVVFLIFAIPLSIFFIIYFGWRIYFTKVKGIKPKKGTVRRVGHGSKIKRIFWDFPRQFVLDSLNRDPDEFREYGFNMICGEQGSGKTVTTTYMLRRYQQMYERLKVKTNYGYKFQDAEITGWQDVVESNNGIYGEIDVLDEVHLWFGSLQSKDFPPEMLRDICQQRKQRKMIIGTAQVFTRTSKAIREQTYWLYLPITLFNCITIVRKYRPRLSAETGQLKEKKLRGCFFFVHDEELRSIYDTYDRIKKMAEKGFKSDESRNESTVTVVSVRK